MSKILHNNLGREPLTSSQAWREAEFLPFLALLPEEIVSESPVSALPTIKFNPLATCYAPEVGRGSKSISIAISNENFQAYNDALVERIGSSSSGKWISFLTAHLKTSCNCEEMVRRKNDLYKKSLPTGDSKVDLFPAENECESHISREIP